jgi:hypothetical protein
MHGTAGSIPPLSLNFYFPVLPRWDFQSLAHEEPGRVLLRVFLFAKYFGGLEIQRNPSVLAHQVAQSRPKPSLCRTAGTGKISSSNLPVKESEFQVHLYSNSEAYLASGASPLLSCRYLRLKQYLSERNSSRNHHCVRRKIVRKAAPGFHTGNSLQPTMRLRTSLDRVALFQQSVQLAREQEK